MSVSLTGSLKRATLAVIGGSVLLTALVFPGQARAAFPGRNGKIVYDAGNSQTDIWKMDPDGTHRVRLTRGPQQDYDAAWSPNGRMLVFVRNGDIFKMRGDGSRIRRLTNNAALDTDPAWSKNGRRIVYSTSAGPGPDSEIAHMSRNGSDRQVVTSNDFEDSAPVWSPAFNVIAYTSFRDGTFQVRAMNANGSEDGVWDSDPGGSLYPDWSPAGGAVVFERGFPSDLWVTDGGFAVQLTNTGANELTPVYSPNQRKIAYMKNGRIWIMTSSGNNQHPVPHTGQSEANPDWQPK